MAGVLVLGKITKSRDRWGWVCLWASWESKSEIPDKT
jgi:hypothetical protein